MKEVLADKAGPSGCASVQMDCEESFVDELQLDALVRFKITLQLLLELYFMKMNYYGTFLKIKVLFRML